MVLAHQMAVALAVGTGVAAVGMACSKHAPSLPVEGAVLRTGTWVMSCDDWFELRKTTLCGKGVTGS